MLKSKVLLKQPKIHNDGSKKQVSSVSVYVTKRPYLFLSKFKVNSIGK